MLLIIIWYFFIIIFGLGLGIDLQKLASASASTSTSTSTSASPSRFWPRLTSLFFFTVHKPLHQPEQRPVEQSSIATETGGLIAQRILVYCQQHFVDISKQ